MITGAPPAHSDDLKFLCDKGNTFVRIDELQFIGANYLQILRFAERVRGLINAIEPKLRDTVIVARDAEWCRALHQMTLDVLADMASKLGYALN